MLRPVFHDVRFDKNRKTDSGRMDRPQIDRQMRLQTNARADRQTDRKTDGPKDRRTERQTDRKTDGPKDRRTDCKTDGPKDGRTERQTDGPKDGRTERRTDRKTDGPKDKQQIHKLNATEGNMAEESFNIFLGLIGLRFGTPVQGSRCLPIQRLVNVYGRLRTLLKCKLNLA